MQAQVENIRQELSNLRKSSKLPHWRMCFAEKMLSRAMDYIAIEREAEAQIVIDKLNRWIKQHQITNMSKQREAYSFSFWNKNFLEKSVREIRLTLANKWPLVPPMERDSINRRLKMVEECIETSNFQSAHDELLVLRTTLINRLRRSFRARISAVTAYKKGVQPEGTLIGPYNAQHTLEETMHVVGERDPIWVEDFLEIYNELFRITERLAVQEKR